MNNENTLQLLDLDSQMDFLQEHFGTSLDIVRERLNDAENNKINFNECQRLIHADLTRIMLKDWKRGDNTKEFVLAEDFDVDDFIKTNLSANVCANTDNIMISKQLLKRLKNAKGADIQTEIFKINEVVNLIVKHGNNPDAIAKDLASAGIAAITRAMGEGVKVAILTGSAIAMATAAGIVTAGVALVVMAVTLILSIFLVLLKAEKKLMGLIINETNEDIFVHSWQKGFDGGKIKNWEQSDLYMSHGRMTDFMHDDSKKDGHPVQIAASEIDDYVYAGLYYMTKRDGALVGVETTMKLTVGKNTVDLFAACPFSDNNRTGIAINSGKRPKEIHKSLYDKDSMDEAVEDKANHLRVQSRINHKRGQHAFAITVITDTSKFSY